MLYDAKQEKQLRSGRAFTLVNTQPLQSEAMQCRISPDTHVQQQQTDDRVSDQQQQLSDSRATW